MSDSGDSPKGGKPISEVPYCLLVPERIVGPLIGPKGAKIQAIQAETSTSIDVSKRHEPSTHGACEKLVVIKGNSEQKMEAIQQIADVIEENAEEPGTELKELVALIPATSVPLVIGSRGATIKELQGKSDAIINVSKSGIPGRVTIKGDKDKIMAAMTAVYEVVETDKRGGSNFQPQAQLSAGMMQSTGAGYGGYGGPAEFGMGGGGGGGKGFGGYNSGYAPASQVDWYMVIPASCCSAIIGARGSVVNDIQQRSGAVIDIPKTDQGGDDKTIVIRGPCYQSKSYGLDLILHQLAQCREFNQSGQAPPIRFQIHGSTAGKLVGPGGQIVQRISQQTNSRIDVGREPFGRDDQYRLVSVSGDVNAIVAAARAIFEVCQ